MSQGQLLVICVAAGIAACTPAATPAATESPPLATPSPGATRSGSPTPVASSSIAGERPPSCAEASFAWEPVARQLLLVTCVGQAQGQASEQVWSWDGGHWQVVDGTGPPPLVVTGIAYDTDRAVLVRYGGQPLDSNTCLPETWEWGAASWTRVASGEVSRPTACDHAKLAYDADRKVTLLFGGGDEHGQLAPDTWGWDGAGWTRLAEMGPAPRAHFGFLDDAAHDHVLLYGGYDGNQVFGDFWSWDGAAWQPVDLTAPGPRSHEGLALSTESVLLLFGGATGPSTFTTLTADTWVLDDGAWTKREVPGPSVRGSPALGFDPDREVWVLYGGFGANGGELGDTWEWDGSAWRCVDRC